MVQQPRQQVGGSHHAGNSGPAQHHRHHVPAARETSIPKATACVTSISTATDYTAFASLPAAAAGSG
jgi:hypothetical protein